MTATALQPSLFAPSDCDPPEAAPITLSTTAPYQPSSEASLEAREWKLPDVSHDKRIILAYLLVRPKASNRQIARDTGLMYATVCARRNDLMHKDGLVEVLRDTNGREIKEYDCGKTGAALVRIIPARRAEVEAFLRAAANMFGKHPMPDVIIGNNQKP